MLLVGLGVQRPSAFWSVPLLQLRLGFSGLPCGGSSGQERGRWGRGPLLHRQALTLPPDMEFLEVLTEHLDRVLLVRGGGQEVITIYS